jgi:hypothetical protein
VEWGDYSIGWGEKHSGARGASALRAAFCCVGHSLIVVIHKWEATIDGDGYGSYDTRKQLDSASPVNIVRVKEVPTNARRLTSILSTLIAALALSLAIPAAPAFASSSVCSIGYGRPDCSTSPIWAHLTEHAIVITAFATATASVTCYAHDYDNWNVVGCVTSYPGWTRDRWSSVCPTNRGHCGRPADG